MKFTTAVTLAATVATATAGTVNDEHHKAFAAFTLETTTASAYSDSNTRQRSFDCMADDQTAALNQYATTTELALPRNRIGCEGLCHLARSLAGTRLRRPNGARRRVTCHVPQGMSMPMPMPMASAHGPSPATWHMG